MKLVFVLGLLVSLSSSDELISNTSSSSRAAAHAHTQIGDSAVPTARQNQQRVMSSSWVQSSAHDDGWVELATDSTGKYLLAASIGGNSNVFVSNDFGSTWRDVGIGGGNSVFTGVCTCSSSGQFMAVIGNTGANIYLSSDYGASWEQLFRSGMLSSFSYWMAVELDSSGQKLYAVSESTICATFTSGGDWMCQRTKDWWHPQAMAISGSGQMQLVSQSSDYDSGGLHRSSDYGGTWEQIDSHKLEWSAIAMSGSGQYAIAAVRAARYPHGPTASIHYSLNFGSTWAVSDAPPLTFWNQLAVSVNGQLMAAAGDDATIYVSTNFGVNWVASTAPYGLSWYAVAVDSSGSVIHAAAFNGGIYTLMPAPTATPTTAPTPLPSAVPTLTPTDIPTQNPALAPTAPPTPTSIPTARPSNPTMAPTVGVLHKTYFKHSINGLTPGQFMANLEANNVVWCATVTSILNGAPENCRVTKAIIPDSELRRRRLDDAAVAQVYYDIIFNSAARGFPDDPAGAQWEIYNIVSAAVSAGEFAAKLAENAILYDNVDMSSITLGQFIGTNSLTLVGGNDKTGSASDETATVIIGAAVGGGVGLILLALFVAWYFSRAGKAAATGVESVTHTRVKIHDEDEGVVGAAMECVVVQHEHKGDVVMVMAEAVAV